jgi:hypothetical protein
MVESKSKKFIVVDKRKPPGIYLETDSYKRAYEFITESQNPMKYVVYALYAKPTVDLDRKV